MTTNRHPAGRGPVSAEPMNGSATPTPWDWVRGHLRRSSATYWLATVRPDGAPHVMPVLAVWVEDRPYVSMGPDTRKARNLDRDARCVVTVEHEPLDLVVEGTAVRTRDEDTLRRVARAYDETYGWRVTVRDGGLDAAGGGALTAGPPPYDVYRVAPATAYGFGTDGSVAATRWRFREPDHRAAGR
ncbi:pyridoxamine 5'-phosphate oxidase family protein [Streptosporangium oxazolinicum]|uniref:Pyridoxamine 5'-phosphate oxidase family protein n=1 Tax=Streptosporangium oxazolinicum TaxID=909287 RepID=A0ABP8BJ41_9ACTN